MREGIFSVLFANLGAGRLLFSEDDFVKSHRVWEVYFAPDFAVVAPDRQPWATPIVERILRWQEFTNHRKAATTADRWNMMQQLIPNWV